MYIHPDLKYKFVAKSNLYRTIYLHNIFRKKLKLGFKLSKIILMWHSYNRDRKKWIMLVWIQINPWDIKVPAVEETPTYCCMTNSAFI